MHSPKGKKVYFLSCFYSIALIFLFVFSIHNGAFAAKQSSNNDKSAWPVIIIGAEDNWIPYANPDGSGLAADIVTAAYNAVDIEVQFVIKPYNRLLKEVKSGKLIGAYNVPYDDMRNKEYLFHKEKLYDAVSKFYHNKDRPVRLNDKQEILDTPITTGLVSDYGYGQFILDMVNDNTIKPIYTRSDRQNILKLAKGRIDAAIIFDKTANFFLDTMNLNTIEPLITNQKVPVFIGFSKEHPSSQYYADKLDKGLAQIKKNGVWQTIMDKY